jgi:hypothetical protein
MLGWRVNVKRENMPELLLATWLTGVLGLIWLKDLVRQGQATVSENVGYPDTYRVAARHVQQALAAGIPESEGPPVFGDDYVLPTGWVGDPDVDFDALRALDGDEPIIVEAWDQS